MSLFSLSLFLVAFVSPVSAQVSGFTGLADFEIFKEDVIQHVYDDDRYIPLMDIQQARYELESLSRDADALSGVLAQAQSRYTDSTSEYSRVSFVLQQILDSMETAQTILQALKTKTTLSLSAMKTAQKDIVVLEEDIIQLREYLRVYAVMLYKVTNDYYLSDDQVSELKLLTKSSDVARSLGKDDLIQLLQTNLEETFALVQRQHDARATRIQQLGSAISQYRDAMQEYSQRMDTLSQQEEHMQQLLIYTKSTKAFANSEIQKLSASYERLVKQRTRMDEIAHSTRNFLDRNSNVYELLEEVDRQDSPTYFSRPIRIVPTLLDTDDVLHNGGDGGVHLDATQGDSVHAPAPGIVYTLHTDDSLQLSWMILLHKYGYSTVVYPLSGVTVQQGDVVKRGEIIGYVGGKPGSHGAGLDSLREHLSFEVYKNSERIDPLMVLDTSVFTTKDQLDAEYHLKWKQDYLARRVDISGIPKLQGETVQERRDYFLSRSGGAVFGDPQLRLTAAQDTGIDPVFGICIGAAETSYRNFKSGNNIGNVGNDDSGNTVVFDSPAAGVRSIFDTLNNRYLGDYHTMDQLSRFGNTHSYIYASSKVNRQRNIMRCLSAIYEVNVTEDFMFRVAQ